MICKALHEHVYDVVSTAPNQSGWAQMCAYIMRFFDALDCLYEPLGAFRVDLLLSGLKKGLP